MKVDTRFNFGDKVWNVYRTIEAKYVVCNVCEGNRSVTIGGEKLTCPKCRGVARLHDGTRVRVIVDGPYTVGLIRAEHRNSEAEWRQEYMCVETGIGSGTVYHSENLYGTQEAAQQEAEQRNRIEAAR